ncbi:type IV toxin-antitoxin system AbiEi family antitoxin domain-containing protein [Acetobacterium sp.]|jgi:predicted transcriptional regulator of viral defense system|uniref:type IV toxin-antitoxin system AbiEi family antitoxin domain-containing protein n=1 Tax=Acetobacterium sp. TaxID=1872094 RepID=UPI000CBD4F55|nr:type IV toxin-antitoxin system AbiEi family antitoxin domain-containing protein [Acetobacterium sp.]MDO9492573.1 type IV toxin-antitoxin system AbiEi family antitoxin domain-containing protein [Acetobacterium sp.]PKM73666.1 MAG: hypothetical protein CVU92_06425 [Firmicutes bacterium HGW-Firmicutes-17]
MKNERREKIIKVFQVNDSVVRTKTLREHKISSRDLYELITMGEVVKVKTGYYALNTSLAKLTDFEWVHQLIPNGIISVFSAASVYELTTVNPMAISVTISSNMIKPSLPDYPPIEFFFSSEANLLMGVSDFQMDGKSVTMYNRERTVCDFFKYSARVGNDLALEVLKNYMAGKEKNLSLLFEYAVKLRVKKYIKPYVEALL